MSPLRLICVLPYFGVGQLPNFGSGPHFRGGSGDKICGWATCQMFRVGQLPKFSSGPAVKLWGGSHAKFLVSLVISTSALTSNWSTGSHMTFMTLSTSGPMAAVFGNFKFDAALWLAHWWSMTLMSSLSWPISEFCYIDTYVQRSRKFSHDNLNAVTLKSAKSSLGAQQHAWTTKEAC